MAVADRPYVIPCRTGREIVSDSSLRRRGRDTSRPVSACRPARLTRRKSILTPFSVHSKCPSPASRFHRRPAPRMDACHSWAGHGSSRETVPDSRPDEQKPFLTPFDAIAIMSAMVVGGALRAGDGRCRRGDCSTSSSGMIRAHRCSCHMAFARVAVTALGGARAWYGRRPGPRLGPGDVAAARRGAVLHVPPERRRSSTSWAAGRLAHIMLSGSSASRLAMNASSASTMAWSIGGGV